MRIQGRGSATPDWAGPALAGDCPGPGGLLEEETLTYLWDNGQNTKPDPTARCLHAMNLRHLRAMPTGQGDSIE